MIKRQHFDYFENPPKIYASIQTADGEITRQNFNMMSGEYYPNRVLAPLVLTPVIGYFATDSEEVVNNAATKLSDGHWYRFDLTSDGSFSTKNEITNGRTVEGQPSLPLYQIDNTLGSATYGRITIRENVSPNSPVTYVFVANLTVGSSSYRVSQSFRVECDQTSVRPRLFFDGNALGRWDPWGSEPAKVTITPRISPENLPVSYHWLFRLGSEWVELDSTPLSWAVSKSGNSIIIDRSVMPSQIALKCTATVTVDGSVFSVEKEVAHVRRLPRFDFDISRVTDLMKDDRTISPYALIQTSRKVIDNPGDELILEWFGSGTTPIATGINPTIPVASLGTAMNLGLQATDAGGYKALVDSDGAFLVDSDGALIICK
ncbi:MAG: hypothetical protein J1E95_04225 [Muribaculaceae bacterium]|nr:hypothetical protein [Muribaculaceae bacterium]